MHAPAAVPETSVWRSRLALTAIPARRFLPGDRIASGLVACEPLARQEQVERWQAWSLSLWSHVVVKLPRDEYMEDLRTVRALAREARVLRRLSHPSVPRLLEDAHEHPVPHLVLEHTGGRTVGQLLARGPLPPGDVVHVGMCLASCLRHVHGRGLVHLGLEPSGIAVHGDHAVLLDFGDARRAGGPPPAGKPHGVYHAPERCLRGAPHPRMDLFSLGAVLYELATGRPPFPAEEVAARCEHSQLLVTPIRARRLRRRLPVRLDAAIHALLDRDPRRRPQTADEALALLAPADVPCA